MVRDWDLNPDHSRGERLGFDETVFCAGKSADQVRRILQGAVDTGIPLLLTRLESDKVARLPDHLSARAAGGQRRQWLWRRLRRLARIERNTHTVD